MNPASAMTSPQSLPLKAHTPMTHTPETHTPMTSTSQAHTPEMRAPGTHTPGTPAASTRGTAGRCAYCGRALPAGVTSRRQYCCDRCRRQAQDRQRRLDRREAAAHAPTPLFMSDPWERGGLWDTETLWALSLLDPNPRIPA